MRWERVLGPEGWGKTGPGRRWGHTCNTVKVGRLVYVFGGYGLGNSQTNDVHVFDADTQTWSKPIVKGTPPCPRDSHSCTTVGDSLFVFGGTDGKRPLGDLHVLNTLTNTWTKPNVSGIQPAAREGHGATLVDKRIFIFGGCAKTRGIPEELHYNDLIVLDTENMEWNYAMTSGNPPSARESHTCSSWKNLIIVIGGEDFADYYLSDVHILDVDNFIWRELKTSGMVITPRAGHATVAFGKHMFVFGGFTDGRKLYDDLYVLNVEAGVWSKISGEGMGPNSRFSLAGDCFDETKGVLLFCGGCNESLESLDDVYYLYTDLLLQNDEEESRQEKLSLRKKLKKKGQEHQILPFHKGLSMCSTMPMYQPVTLKPSYEEKKFEATVTDVFHSGYTIETTIDGKPLRGLLFSCKPDFGNAANSYISRKRVLAVGNDVQDRYGRKMKIAGTDEQAKTSDCLQEDNCQEKASPLNFNSRQLDNLDPIDLTTVDVLPSQPVSGKTLSTPAPDLNSTPTD